MKIIFIIFVFCFLSGCANDSTEDNMSTIGNISVSWSRSGGMAYYNDDLINNSSFGMGISKIIDYNNNTYANLTMRNDGNGGIINYSAKITVSFTEQYCSNSYIKIANIAQSKDGYTNAIATTQIFVVKNGTEVVKKTINGSAGATSDAKYTGDLIIADTISAIGVIITGCCQCANITGGSNAIGGISIYSLSPFSADGSSIRGCEIAGQAIQFADVDSSCTIQSPMHYVNSKGIERSLSLVSPDVSVASKFCIKCDPNSDYVKQVLGENSDGILALGKFS